MKDFLLVPLKRLHDSRGWFSETHNQQYLESLGFNKQFVQTNTSYTQSAYTLRGLHAQRSPHRTCKAITVIKGSIQDIFVDGRKESQYYGQVFDFVLTEQDPYMLIVPPGCYHGVLTLEPDTIIQYHLDGYYEGSSETGIAWNDPDLCLPWIQTPVVISDKDCNWPHFSNQDSL